MVEHAVSVEILQRGVGVVVGVFRVEELTVVEVALPDVGHAV